MKPKVRSRHPVQGQSLTEFALIAPVLFLVFFAIIQFGFLFAGQNGLVNGVRDTARYASTYRVTDAASATAACSFVKTQLSNNLRVSLPGFTATRVLPTIRYRWLGNPDGSKYIRVEVSASYDHPLFIPLVGNIVDGLDGKNDRSFTIGASEQMRIENPALTTTGGPVTCP